MIDLNSDIGEGFGPWRMGDDMALMDVISSANIACGFHAGDPRTMENMVAAAVERNVAIGAHVSYPDRVGFGRRAMRLSAREIITDVLYQIGALDGLARAAGGRVTYVKPHGALYNRMAVAENEARAVVEALRRYGNLRLVTLPSPVVQQAADAAAVPIAIEAFADRAYTHDGTLVPRTEPNAVIHDSQAVVARVVRMARDGIVRSRDGVELSVSPQTLCLHGDTPGAAALATAIRAGLEDAGIDIGPIA